MIYKNWGLEKKNWKPLCSICWTMGWTLGLGIFSIIIRVELPFWENFGGNGEFLQEYIDWPCWSKWISLNFIAQLVEHCSTNAEANRSNPVEVRPIFWGGLGGGGVNLQLLKLQLPLRRSYLHSNLYFRISHYLHEN